MNELKTVSVNEISNIEESIDEVNKTLSETKKYVSGVEEILKYLSIENEEDQVVLNKYAQAKKTISLLETELDYLTKRKTIYTEVYFGSTQNLSERIESLCALKGITIAFLERSCELSNGTIKRWVNSSPTADKLLRVCKFFNVSSDYLLGYSTSIETDVIILEKIFENYNVKVNESILSDEDKLFILAILDFKRLIDGEDITVDLEMRNAKLWNAMVAMDRLENPNKFIISPDSNKYLQMFADAKERNKKEDKQ